MPSCSGTREVVAVLASFLLVGWVTDSVPLAGNLDPRSIDEDCVQSPAPPRAVSPSPAVRAPTAEPRSDGTSGRAIGGLSRDACERALREQGVAFDRVEPREAPSVAMPLALRGPLAGIRIAAERGASPINSVIDCRLAAAILAWAPDLRAQGIAAIEHVSILRPGAHIAGSSRVSGHAHALALDALAFVRDDGTRLTVLDDWADRTAGADPCAERQGEEPDSARMRNAVCTAARRELFQVVLTPHHDTAHANHVHLEVRPGVTWSYVR